jgi:hypothetical protein
MHPDILRQLTAGHIQKLITDAGEARRAREARHARWQRPWLGVAVGERQALSLRRYRMRHAVRHPASR